MPVASEVIQHIRVNGTYVNDDVCIEYVPIVYMDAASEWKGTEYPE